MAGRGARAVGYGRRQTLPRNRAVADRDSHERFGIDAEGGKVKRYYPHESVGIATGILIAALHRAGLATLTISPVRWGFSTIFSAGRRTKWPICCWSSVILPPIAVYRISGVLRSTTTRVSCDLRAIRRLDLRDRASLRATGGRRRHRSVCGLYADASVMRHIADALSVDAASAMFAKALRHNANPVARARYWHLSHQRTAQPLGIAAIVRDATISSRGELGLMLLPHAQHSGAGIQALGVWSMVRCRSAGDWASTKSRGRHTAEDTVGAGRLVEYLGFEPFETGTPGSIGWRLTRDAWHARLALRATNPHHR